MTIVSPATTTEPSRTSPLLVATPIVAAPVPLPLAPSTIASQGALLAAVQEHAAELAVTETRIDPPEAATPVCDAATVNRHGAASCARSTVASFTRTVPRRAIGSGFAATRNATVPSPCPDVPSVIEIHELLVVADQVQSLVVATATLPLAPAYGAEFSVVDAVT